MFDKAEIQNLVKTSLFYVLIFFTYSILEWSFPSGMCGPGPSYLFGFLSVFIIIGLIIRNWYQYVHGQKEVKYSLILHISIVGLMILLIAIS